MGGPIERIHLELLSFPKASAVIIFAKILEGGKGLETN